MIRFITEKVDPKYVEALKACGQETNGRITIDEKSDCYVRIREQMAADIPEKTPTTMKSVTHGAIGLYKATLQPPSSGVGTEIKLLLNKLRITSCGACVEKAAEWDFRGIEYCEQHVDDELVPYLTQRAAEKHWALGLVGTIGTKPLVLLAIANAKSK